jgi:hypothetical protein
VAWGSGTKVAHGSTFVTASAAEARAHALMRRVFRRAGLRIATQDFPVPGRGRSRNTIGMLKTPHACLRIVMANSDHREFELLGLSGAKLGVRAGGEPCRHSPCDTPGRLDPASLRLARRLVEPAIGAHSAEPSACRRSALRAG